MTVCKDQKGKCGISFFSQSKGVFVVFVAKGSPAAMAGIRFGDQILTVSHLLFKIMVLIIKEILDKEHYSHFQFELSLK